MTDVFLHNNLNKCIIEYPKSISPVLCQDYIDLFERNTPHGETIFRIPKQNTTTTAEDWRKMEIYLYKQLLIKIQTYKQKLLFHLDDKYICNLNAHLEKEFYVKDFIIKKYENIVLNQKIEIKNPSRYNLLSFVLFLTDGGCEGSHQIQFLDTFITPEKGKLVIFPEEIIPKFVYELPVEQKFYVITSQFCKSI